VEARHSIPSSPWATGSATLRLPSPRPLGLTLLRRRDPGESGMFARLGEALPRALMDDLFVRAFIRAKVVMVGIPPVWGGTGNSEGCNACEEAVEKDRLIVEGISAEGTTFKFHAGVSGVGTRTGHENVGMLLCGRCPLRASAGSQGRDCFSPYNPRALPKDLERLWLVVVRFQLQKVKHHHEERWCCEVAVVDVPNPLEAGGLGRR